MDAQRRLGRLLAGVVCGLLCLGYGHMPHLHAQSTGLLLGTPIEDQVQAGDATRYRFQAVAGSVLSFQVTAQDEGLDPVLRVLNEAGEVLIENDDFAPQQGKNALIEAFTVPTTGNYSLEVSGFGGTTGAYTLKALVGYANVVQTDNFSGASTWSAEGYRDVMPTAQNSDGALVLSLEGIDQVGIAWSAPTTLRDFYAGVQVKRITARNNWIVGLALRTAGANGIVMFNQQGTWRYVLLSDAGVLTVVREWTAHPAIVAGATSFRMDVLAYAGALDVFYDGQFVGTVTGALNGEISRLGAFVQTDNALDSRVEVALDDYQVTLPTLINGARVILERLVRGRDTSLIQQFQRQGVIPSGGQVLLSIPTLNAQALSAGVSAFPVARGQTFGDFVLGVTVTRPSANQGVNGCGVMMRQSDAQNYVLAFSDSAGGYGLAERLGDAFSQHLFVENVATATPNTQLIVVALGRQATLYVDGRRVGSIASDLSAGGLGLAVVNYAPQDTACDYRDLWLWTP